MRPAYFSVSMPFPLSSMDIRRFSPSILTENRMELARRKGRMAAVFLAAMMTVSALLTGCGGASNGAKSSMTADLAAPAENTAAQESYGSGVASDSYAAASEELAMEDGGEAAGVQEQDAEPDLDSMTLLEEKLVYHCNLEIETLDYPATMTSIKEAISRYGGVIQSESESDSGHNWYYADYRKTGGTPHLDGTYTVFGEVTEGLDVVEKIQRAYTDYDDRPVNDIRILRTVITGPYRPAGSNAD